MNNKLETVSNLFEGKEIRSIWDFEKEEYYFSVVDVISALTDSINPRKYWSVLKNRLKKEGSELTTKCSQLKMPAPDGKVRLRDALDTKGIFRLIESVPSPKAEPFKLWLANLGSERIDEVFDPEIAVNRAINYYRNKGYTDEWIKRRLIQEGSELHENIVQLKMKAHDGKMRKTDTLDTKGILRLIESVPSPKAEPFKLWLANLGSERIDEVFDPEMAVNRAVEYYRNKGYTDEWIKARLTGIVDRFKLTDVWKEGGINKPIEYALLTNEIYKGWSGMKASEYKKYKGIRKESLRDNMTDIEVALTNIGEIAARDIAITEKPQGLKENLKVAKRGGGVAKGARDLYEKETKKSAISNKNSLNYKYVDEVKEIESKGSDSNE